eukprot:15057462-Alexandrium_andersonii.AAC.1
MFSCVDDVLGPRSPLEAKARPRAKRRRLASQSLLATADPPPSSSSEQSSSEDSDSQPDSVGSDVGGSVVKGSGGVGGVTAVADA